MFKYQCLFLKKLVVDLNDINNNTQSEVIPGKCPWQYLPAFTMEHYSPGECPTLEPFRTEHDTEMFKIASPIPPSQTIFSNSVIAQQFTSVINDVYHYHIDSPQRLQERYC